MASQFVGPQNSGTNSIEPSVLWSSTATSTSIVLIEVVLHATWMADDVTLEAGIPVAARAAAVHVSQCRFMAGSEQSIVAPTATSFGSTIGDGAAFVGSGADPTGATVGFAVAVPVGEGGGSGTLLHAAIANPTTARKMAACLMGADSVSNFTGS